jgi:hypothetical protein
VSLSLSPLALLSVQDPGFLQDLFPGVSGILSYFSAASNTHVLETVFSVVRPSVSWLSNRSFFLLGYSETLYSKFFLLAGFLFNALIITTA